MGHPTKALCITLSQAPRVLRLGLLLQKGGGNEHAGKMLKEQP